MALPLGKLTILIGAGPFMNWVFYCITEQLLFDWDIAIGGLEIRAFHKPFDSCRMITILNWVSINESS